MFKTLEGSGFGADEDDLAMGMFSFSARRGCRSGDASGDGEPRKYDLKARYAKTGAGVSGPSRMVCSWEIMVRGLKER